MKKIMIAGVSGGSGKTTVTCALLRYFVNNGVRAASFKCGPDYIDTMFHREIIGAPAYNLDSYLMDGETLRYLFIKNSGDISVIEGVMGFYDGVDFGEKTSAYEISTITDTPVILVVDARKMANSAGALLKGFLEYEPNNIKGVIFNCVNAQTYEGLKEVCGSIGIKPVGYFPYIDESKLANRYLGLVTPLEISDLKDRLDYMANIAADTLDIDAILSIAADVPDVLQKDAASESKVKLAVARDKAFCFYYEDNMQILRELGAEIELFSPLEDEKIPEGVDGLILYGGYTELYAEKLAKNETMKQSVYNAIKSGLPCIAERGGFMYLHESMYDVTGRRHEMTGVIEGECRINEPSKRFGYIELEAGRDNLLCSKGDKILAYEVRSYDSDDIGSDFMACTDERAWRCIYADDTLFAGYPHIHFYANTEFARNFIKRCEEYKKTGAKK